MDFSRQLASLARAANSNNRENSSSNNNNSNNNQSQGGPPHRRHHEYNNHRGGGGRGGNSRHSYHPYNNNRRGGGHNKYNNNHSNNLTQAELEFYLPKLIEAIPKYQPITTLLPKKKSKRRHVALLFLTIDDLPFEHLWRAFLNNYKLDGGGVISNGGNGVSNDGTAIIGSKEGEETNPSSNNDKSNPNECKSSETDNSSINNNNYNTNVDENNNMNIDPSLSNSDLLVSVLCHAKFPERVRSPWLQQRLLVSKTPNNRNRHNNNNNNNNYHNNRRYNNDDRIRYHTRRPEWGSVDITRAMIDLLEEGLKIGKSKSNYDQDERHSYARYMATTTTSSNNNGTNDISLSSQDASSISTTSAATSTTSNPSISNESIPEVDRFIFVSESCLPMVTLQEMEMALFGQDEQQQQQQQQQQSRTSKRQKINHEDDQPQSTTISNITTTQQYHEHYKGVNANKSWLNAYNKPNNGYARILQWDATSNAIPRNCIYKADQWIVLTRKHAWPLISLIDDAVKLVQQTYSKNQNSSNNDGGGYYSRGRSHGHGRHYPSHSNFKVSLWQCFDQVKASDEMYFPTAMALLGILSRATDDVVEENKEENDGSDGKKDLQNTSVSGEKQLNNDSFEDEIAFTKVTYCDWSEKGKNPLSFVVNKEKDSTYSELKKRISMAREEGCLIGRKFIPGGYAFKNEETISVNEWISIIQNSVPKL